MPLDLSEVLNDPETAESFTILRSTGGQFVQGIWQDSKTSISSYGVISEPDGEEVMMIPEGDRVLGALVIHTQAQIYETHEDTKSGISDIVVWQGLQWRVMHVWNYAPRNYWKALATRMKGS